MQEFLGPDLRNIKGQLPTSRNTNRQHSRKQFLEAANQSDSKSSDASTSLSNENLHPVELPSTSIAAEVNLKLLQE